jgi:hypothetical protein
MAVYTLVSPHLIGQKPDRTHRLESVSEDLTRLRSFALENKEKVNIVNIDINIFNIMTYYDYV